jgi:hypothetical protein
MRVFQIRARSLDDPRPDAGAIVVAKDADEAMILLRKDINFAGYALPPAEMAPVSIDTEEVRRVLGEDAAHEKGVYGFRLLNTQTA